MGTARPSAVKRPRSREALLQAALKERFLNVELAAAYLDVSTTTVARYRARGILPPKARFTREELDRAVVPPKRGKPRKKTQGSQPKAELEGGDQRPTSTPPVGGAGSRPDPSPGSGSAAPEPRAAALPEPKSAEAPSPARKSAEVNPKDQFQINLPRPSGAKRAEVAGNAAKSPSAEAPPSAGKSGEEPQKEDFWW